VARYEEVEKLRRTDQSTIATWMKAVTSWDKAAASYNIAVASYKDTNVQANEAPDRFKSEYEIADRTKISLRNQVNTLATEKNYLETYINTLTTEWLRSKLKLAT
jgi:hypothetical protein